MTKPELCPNDCPPDAATSASGTYYRMVKECPPSSTDFKSYLEEGKKIVDERKKCLACGLSVFKSIYDARHHQNLFPAKNLSIAEANFKSEDGTTLDTPSRQYPNHATWWPQQDTVRHQLFRCI
jgi:ribosomal protein S27AE